MLWSDPVFVFVCVLVQNGGDGALAAAEPGGWGRGHHEGVQGEMAARLWRVTTAQLAHCPRACWLLYHFLFLMCPHFLTAGKTRSSSAFLFPCLSFLPTVSITSSICPQSLPSQGDYFSVKKVLSLSFFLPAAWSPLVAKITRHSSCPLSPSVAAAASPPHCQISCQTFSQS